MFLNKSFWFYINLHFLTDNKDQEREVDRHMAITIGWINQGKINLISQILIVAQICKLIFWPGMINTTDRTEVVANINNHEVTMTIYQGHLNNTMIIMIRQNWQANLKALTEIEILDTKDIIKIKITNLQISQGSIVKIVEATRNTKDQDQKVEGVRN